MGTRRQGGAGTSAPRLNIVYPLPPPIWHRAGQKKHHWNPLPATHIYSSFFHCGKAFIRSELWQPESWPEDTRISFGREIGEQIGKGKDFVEDLDAQVLERYKDSL
jgi:hypothetical protein